jgi:hypothetical protein
MKSAIPHLARRLLLGIALTLAFASAAGADTTKSSAAGTLPSATLRPAPLERADTPQTSPADDTAHDYAYGWPVKPFRRQHPVRGFFGDPRIGNHGVSRQFHFGVDVAAPNGTPVYATITGRIHLDARHPTTVSVIAPDGVELSYWHIVPVVRGGGHAVAYRTVLGRVQEPWAHVHLSESRNGRYLNPLRPGAMGPFVDETTPVVRSVVVERSGAVVAEAYDETPIAVPRPWQDLPVTAALVRWRVVGAAGRTILDWRTVGDFRETIPPASSFDAVWAPGTTQNHVRAPGRYRLLLSRALPRFGRGTYVLEVEVRDTRRNTSTRRVLLGGADE